MAAYIKTLQDASHANIIYPRTKAVAVFRDDENTTPVEDTLVTLETQMEGALRDINNINSNINTTNANFSSHAEDSNIHITSAERIAWNSLDSKANGYVNTHNVDTTAHEDIRSELINAKSSTIEYINTQINTHTHSWNDLDDKPFGETESWTLITSLEFEGTYANPNLLDTSVKNIKFVFDGEEYFFDFYGDGTYGGDGYPFEFSAEFSGFAIGYVLYITCDDGFHTVEIYKGKTTVKTIDAKYLPDSVKAQPDWNQNDESAPDFVKNRPFYETSSVIYEASGLTQEYDNATDAYITTVDTSIPLREGSTYKIVIDGVEYTSTCVVNGVNFIIGNGHISFDYLEDTGEPFVIQRTVMPEYDMDVSTIVYEGNDFSAVTIMESTVTHIDAKYLPTPSWNDLKDKPFGDKVTLDSGELTFKKHSALEVYCAFISREIFSVAGDRITVTFDGTEYECIVKADPSGGTDLFAGNGSIHYGFTVAEDTGEPFCLVRNRAFETDIITRSTESSHVVSVTTAQKIAEKYLPPHTYSWNDLKNKPVVFEPSDTLTWDGNTVDRVCVNANGSCFVHMSDAVPSVDDFASGGAFTVMQNGSSDICAFTEENITTFYDGVYGLPTLVFIVVQEEAVGIDLDGAVFPIKGTYLLLADDSTYCSSLTIHNYTGFEQEKIAPSHLYQPDWNQNDESASDYVKNRTHWVESEAHWTPIDSAGSTFIGETVSVSGMNNISQFSGVYQLSNCNKYRVTVNGAEYIAEASYDANSGYYTIGPGSLFIWFNESELNMQNNDSKISSDMSIKIESYVEAVYHPLDAKFLPDTIATKADIEAAIGTAIGGSY